MDEVDGMSAGDRGGMAELIQLIKRTKVGARMHHHNADLTPFGTVGNRSPSFASATTAAAPKYARWPTTASICGSVAPMPG